MNGAWHGKWMLMKEWITEYMNDLYTKNEWFDKWINNLIHKWYFYSDNEWLNEGINKWIYI